MDLIAVFTTVSNTAQADLLAQGAVERGLAACVQMDSIQSTYLWRGSIEKASEIRLMFKTCAALHEPLTKWLGSVHPYELPAIYALAVDCADARYVEWVAASTQALPELQAKEGEVSDRHLP